MKKVDIMYDPAIDVVTAFDHKTHVEIQPEDFEDLLGSGFTVETEQNMLVLSVPPLYKVQLKNDKGAWGTIAVCSPESAGPVYECLSGTYQGTIPTLRVLNPDGEVFLPEKQ